MLNASRFTRVLAVMVIGAIPIPASTLSHGVASADPSEEPSAAAMANDPYFALALHANAVVVATVASRHSYWAPAHDVILTDYAMTTTATIHGTAPSGFAITAEGGEVGEVGLKVSDTVEFEPNASYAVLLENGPRGLQVLGAAGGIRRLDSPVPSANPFLRSLDAALRATDR